MQPESRVQLTLNVVKLFVAICECIAMRWNVRLTMALAFAYIPHKEENLLFSNLIFM